MDAYSLMREAADDRRSSQAGGGTIDRSSNGVGERWFHLYVPTLHGIPISAAVDMIESVNELGLTDVVQIIGDPVERNMEALRWLGVERADAPQPYLEVVYACEAAAVLYYVGHEIEVQLAALTSMPPGGQPSAVA
jgi:hypothetical protein